MADLSKPRVLLVDDEPDLLAGMVRSLRSDHFELATANSGAEALELLRNRGPYAVIVTDLKMPVMDGVELLGRARTVSPDTVRVLFTGAPDLDRAIAAVNEGSIFRFITKPCSRVMMALTLKSCVEQHELITAQRILLEQTLHGAIKALTDVLGLASPLAFGRATRLRRAIRMLASSVGMADGWQIEVAAMLSQIGCVMLPPAVLEKMHEGGDLNEAEEEMLRRVPEVVEQVLSNIPRLEGVREILRYQDKHFDGSGTPSGMVSGEAIPWGGRALKLVVDLDRLESEGMTLSLAYDKLRGRRGWYDPEILEALARVRDAQESSQVRRLQVSSLRPGMILAQDVRNLKGNLFAARGQEVTRGLMEKLKIFAPDLLGGDWIRVIVEAPQQGEAKPRPFAT
jgi:response regulator RpfG family c-di-GMP phosphodiesterase